MEKEALMEKKLNLRDHVMELYGHWKGSCNGKSKLERERERERFSIFLNK
jgi:hypothetical protein